MFSRIFIERPRFAIVISVVMVLAGILCINKLPIAEYPEIAPPSIVVSATYTGASAQVVADTVALPIEDQINGVEDLLYYSSTSDNSGNYQCTITFKTGIDSDIAMVNVQNAIKRAEPKLPEDVTKVGITVQKRSSDILLFVAFLTDGKSMDTLELNTYIKTTVVDPVGRIDGVSSAELMAAKEYSMRIWLDPLRMSALGISTADIANAVAGQNIQAAAGTVGSENSNQFIQYKINVQGRLKTVDEFNEIVVCNAGNGDVVTLADIARVELGSKEYSGIATYNGEESVALAVYRNTDSNALETVKGVKAEIEKIAKRFPAGVTYEIAYDPTEFITVTLEEIVTTIIVALLLVVLITYLFLQDWRATLIPSVAIPVALIGTFPFMLAIGYSINVLTMFGLILVIGSLCDDAIVVVENAQALMEREGLSPKEAAIKSMQQITGAIIATTLVTVACYAPLAFYGGMVGNIYMQFAVTMCISLCLSTVVAMTLSPALCACILRKPAEHPPLIFKPFNATLDASRKIYLFGVKLLVRRAILTVILFAGAMAAAYFLYEKLPSSFLPTEDKGAFMCNVELPPGATLARTESVLAELREHLKDVKGIKSNIMVSGFSFMNGNGENYGMAIVKLDPWDQRKTPELQLEAIQTEVQKRANEISAARIICFTPPAIMGLGVTGGATFMLSGDGEVNPAELSTTARKFALDLSALPETLYAMSTYNADTPQLYLDIDRKKAETLGVSTGTIYSTLQSKLASFYINDFNIMGNTFYVKMQSTGEYRVSQDDIMDIQIPNSSGEMVPLSSLATLRYIVGPQRIQRFNKYTSAEMNAQAAQGVSSSVLMNVIENMKLPSKYHIEWTGMSYQERLNQGQIVFLMMMAMLFAYLFLVAQYESWTIPVPVMLSVGFAVLGALLGLTVLKESLSIYAQLGMVMLIGLAAKNAILMVEFSKQERESGLSVAEAAMNGANLRYRAVLMTAWSFLFGVFPLVIATGAGAGSRKAIGITTFSGMLLATLIGIIFTPALYAVCQRLREWVKAKLHWNKKV